MDAERLAPTLDARTGDLQQLGLLIGAALQTQRVITADPALNARQGGCPYDTERITRFDVLAHALRRAAVQNRFAVAPQSVAYRVQAFYEAYFSNFIEGTEFTLDEARQLVFEDVVPAGRIADSHDVVGTYRVVADHAEMATPATSAGEFVELLKRRHAILMAGRPEVGPGEFKVRANQAGRTLFVAPDLVVGTLHAGFERLADFDTAWERSVYMAFVVAEVHPFNDGNGRVARVMMNSELVVGKQSKIIVPIGGRGDYLAALRQLSRRDDPSLLIKVLRFLHDYTALVDWTSLSTAERDLRTTHGFADEREESFRRLTLPDGEHWPTE